MRQLLERIRLLSRTGRRLQIAAGMVMVVFGLAMVTGELTTFSYWLLARFPFLGRIG